MTSYEEVLNFIEEENVKFIRLAFFDVFGNQKNIAIMPGELRRAFTHGISFDASAIAGFGQEVKSDLFLRPDPTTFSMVPWRPLDGGVCRMFCDIYYPDGTPFEKDTRYMLDQAVKAAAEAGVKVYFGPEMEFYVFKQNEHGEPTDTPIDQASYMDVAPEDRGENLRRDICFTLIDMGITPESSHHEQGPGQNEVDFRYSDPLTAADNTSTCKWAIKNIAESNGVWADFSPKPMRNLPGSGMHLNISVEPIPGTAAAELVAADAAATAEESAESLAERSALARGEHDDHSGSTPHALDPITSQFMAGILKYIREITLFLNPLAKSYERFGQMEAPYYVSWSEQNRSQLIRIPADNKSPRRIELRSPDPTANPYLAYTLLIYAGLEGIKHSLRPDLPMNVNLYKADPELTRRLEKLPSHISEAVQYAKGSEFVKAHITEACLDAYCDNIRMR